VAIGSFAGQINQGQQSIAIGYQAGVPGTAANSVIINASGAAVGSSSSGLFVAPIASSSGGTGVLVYNNTTKEITYEASKTFVIDHPLDQNKYLVHACLEGPENGVYYRGEGEISEGTSFTTISLPNYVGAFASDFSVHLTDIYNGIAPNTLSSSKVENNQFKVYGKPGAFYWMVYGKRSNVNVEPDKESVQLRGSGPYTWIDSVSS
ncbi:MAG: hypothetical protein ACXU9U_04785, partial [Parachlamydiaceae bacterium]